LEYEISDVRRACESAINHGDYWQEEAAKFCEENARLKADASKLERELAIWKSRADAYEENYHQMLKRIDVVANERDDLRDFAKRAVECLENSGIDSPDVLDVIDTLQKLEKGE